MSDINEVPAESRDVPSGTEKHCVYLLDNGHLQIASRASAVVSSHFSAAVTLAVDGGSFRLKADSLEGNYACVAFRPRASCIASAGNARLLTFGINPSSAFFRAFCLLPKPGFAVLLRAEFAHLDAEFDSLLAGRLSVEQAADVHDRLCVAVVKNFPRPLALDKRVEKMLEYVDDAPHSGLGELAKLVKLSYKRASLLFAANVGLSLRSFLLWKKLHRYQALAARYGAVRSITDIAHEAGFVDSAHLCRAFQAEYGVPPSCFASVETGKSWLHAISSAAKKEASIPRRRRRPYSMPTRRAPINRPAATYRAMSFDLKSVEI